MALGQLQDYLNEVLRLQPSKQSLRLSHATLRSMVAQLQSCVKARREVEAVGWTHVIFAHMASSDDEDVPEQCVTMAIACATVGLHFACLANSHPLEIRTSTATTPATTTTTVEQEASVLDRKHGFVHAWDVLRGFMQAASRAVKQSRLDATTKATTATGDTRRPALRTLAPLQHDHAANTCFGVFLGAVLALAHRATCVDSKLGAEPRRQPRQRGTAEVFAVLATVTHRSTDETPAACTEALDAAKRVATLALGEFKAEEFEQAVARQQAALKAASVQDRQTARQIQLQLQERGSSVVVCTLCADHDGSDADALWGGQAMLACMLEYCGQQQLFVHQRSQSSPVLRNPMLEPAHGMYHVLAAVLDAQLTSLRRKKKQRREMLVQSTAALSGAKASRTNKRLSLEARLQAAVTEARLEGQTSRLEKLAQVSHAPLALFSPVTRRTAAAAATAASAAMKGSAVEVVESTCLVWTAPERNEADFLAVLDAAKDQGLSSARSLSSSTSDLNPSKRYAQLIMQQKEQLAKEREKAEALPMQKHAEEMTRQRQLRVAHLRAQRDERKAWKAKSVQLKKQLEEQTSARGQMSARRETHQTKEMVAKLQKELNRVKAIKARKKLLEDNERTLWQQREAAEAVRRARWQAELQVIEQDSAFTGSLEDDEFDEAQLEEELRRQEASDQRVQEVRLIADQFANRLNHGRFFYVHGKPAFLDNVFPDPEPGYLYVPPAYAPGMHESDDDDDDDDRGGGGYYGHNEPA